MTGARHRDRPLSIAVAAGGCLLALLLTSQDASADTVRAPAYRLRLDLDLSVVLVAGATASGFLFLGDSGAGPACMRAGGSCDRSRINAFDRPAAGLYHAGWSNVGDIATASTLLFPPLVILLEEGFANGLHDDLVVAEAALVTSALQVVVSYAVARPRPRVYGSGAPLEDRTDANAARSFFSGHVADTMAVSVAALQTLRRLGKPGLGWLVLGAGTAGSTVVAFARVVSGGHFPSDVIAGAAVGVGLGLALPGLHDSSLRLAPLSTPGGGAGMSVVGVLP
jgi:membrane-associated phospholipid phosphatase